MFFLAKETVSVNNIYSQRDCLFQKYFYPKRLSLSIVFCEGVFNFFFHTWTMATLLRISGGGGGGEWWPGAAELQWPPQTPRLFVVTCWPAHRRFGQVTGESASLTGASRRKTTAIFGMAPDAELPVPRWASTELRWEAMSVPGIPKIPEQPYGHTSNPQEAPRGGEGQKSKTPSYNIGQKVSSLCRKQWN